MSSKLNNEIKKVYSIWSKTYDFEQNPAIIAEKQISVNLLDIKNNDIALDLGCGTGRNINNLLVKTKNVHGVDISEDMLSIAKKRFTQVEFKQSDISKKIPYNNAYFTKILCSLVISHIKKLTPFFAEICRVLAPEGSLVITTIHPHAEFKNYKMKEGERFELMKYNINFQHSIDETNNALKKNSLYLRKKIIVPIDTKLKRYYTPESYNKIKGTPFLLILKIVKN